MRVADPCTRERLNQRLSDSSADYRATTSYYEERPQLAAYTVNTEITRMKYSVVPRCGGAEVTHLEKLYVFNIHIHIHAYMYTCNTCI